jgi:hypothetical protein
MSLADQATSFLSDQGVSNAIVSLATDFGAMFEDILAVFTVMAVVVFLWGLWQIISANKQNSGMGAPTVSGAMLKIIFGAILYTSTTWLEEATLSIWANASPMQPMTYVDRARQALETDPFTASLLAIAVFITMAGWIFWSMALYGFACMGEQQDRHGAFWKNSWMAIGGVIMANIAMFMTDVSQSFGYTGALYSGSGF